MDTMQDHDFIAITYEELAEIEKVERSRHEERQKWNDKPLQVICENQSRAS